MSADIRGGTSVETGELVLVAGAEKFAWLSHRLRSGKATTVELEPLTGWPAIRWIARLRLEPADTVATIEIVEDSATLSGDQESFSRLADEVDLFLEYNDLNEPGMHAHLDNASWAADQPLLGSNSRGLTLVGPVPESFFH